MSTCNLYRLCAFSASLFTLFIRIETKPMEPVIPDHHKQILSLTPEEFNSNSTDQSMTSDPLISSLLTLATSDLNTISTYFNTTSTNNSTYNATSGPAIDIDEILKASMDDNAFSIKMDQLGDSNTTESLEDEAWISDESGSGSGSVDVDEKHIVGEISSVESVDEIGSGTPEATLNPDRDALMDVIVDVVLTMNLTQVVNGTEEAWSTDSLGSPIPALMFA